LPSVGEPERGVSVALTLQELTVRRPVWTALSELYLDTDTRPGLPLLALTLARSQLPGNELNIIWQREVTPLLHANLNSLAGEWAGWNEDWLVEQLQARCPVSGWPPLHRALHRIRAGGVEEDFQTAMTLRSELLTLPPSERVARAAAWSWLARAYFWPDAPSRPEPPPGADLPAIFAALEPHLRPLITIQESAALHRQHVLSFIGGPP
jgi:hypothetical protein